MSNNLLISIHVEQFIDLLSLCRSFTQAVGRLRERMSQTDLIVANCCACVPCARITYFAGRFLAQPLEKKSGRSCPFAQRRATPPPHRREPFLRHGRATRDLPDSHAALAPRHEFARRESSLRAIDAALLHLTTTPAAASAAAGSINNLPLHQRPRRGGSPQQQAILLPCRLSPPSGVN